MRKSGIRRATLMRLRLFKQGAKIAPEEVVGGVGAINLLTGWELAPPAKLAARETAQEVPCSAD
jgi:hypothetical protein